jgi:hypothetical protein
VNEKSCPKPLSGTVWGLPLALSAMVSVPLMVPLLAGSKKTPIEQLALCVATSAFRMENCRIDETYPTDRALQRGALVGYVSSPEDYPVDYPTITNRGFVRHQPKLPNHSRCRSGSTDVHLPRLSCKEWLDAPVRRCAVSLASKVLWSNYGQSGSELQNGVTSGSPTIVPESELYSRIRCLIL